MYMCEAVFILTGNSFTILIFWKLRKRLKRASYLLINLAVADILVGISITIWLWNEIALTADRQPSKTNLFENIVTTTDPLGLLASILSLALISLDRIMAILWPFRHRTLNSWYYYVSVGVVWFLASFIAAVDASSDLYHTERDDGLGLLMASIAIICSIMTITGAYLAIWISTKCSRFPSNTCRTMEQNRKLAKTLFIVTALSIITCLPAGISLALRDYLQNMNLFRVQITVVAQYANSFLNPIIYCFKMPEFKESLRKLLCNCPRERLTVISESTREVTLRSFKIIDAM